VTDNTVSGQASLISFDTSVAAIAPLSALPGIQRLVTIDGNIGGSVVQLDGSRAGSSDGLTFLSGSSGSRLRSLSITNFQNAGVRIETDGITVESSLIGLTPSDVEGANGLGVLVTGPDVSTAFIGTAAAGNVISGNVAEGIRVEAGAGALILGNTIGLNSVGTGPIGNGKDGISIDFAGAVTIGGTNSGEANSIAGNGGNGIHATGSTGLLAILGNRIGIDAASGTVAIANALSGIVIAGPSQALIEGNVISGNGRHGVEISTGSSGNVLLDNVIGLDATGSSALGNGLSGIAVTGQSTINTVGAAGQGNLIAGNAAYGIHLSAGSQGTGIVGNTIGLSGTDLAGVGNALDGIFVESSSSNTIRGNVVSANLANGVHVE
jgi:titin